MLAVQGSRTSNDVLLQPHILKRFNVNTFPRRNNKNKENLTKQNCTKPNSFFPPILNIQMQLDRINCNFSALTFFLQQVNFAALLSIQSNVKQFEVSCRLQRRPLNCLLQNQSGHEQQKGRTLRAILLIRRRWMGRRLQSSQRQHIMICNDHTCKT